MDEGGRVRIAPPGTEFAVGRYRARWRAFLREALQGFDDVATFRACLDLEDPDAFADFCRLYTRYERWVCSKIVLGQVDHGRLIPYHRYVNPRGDKTGCPADDVLPE